MNELSKDQLIKETSCNAVLFGNIVNQVLNNPKYSNQNVSKVEIKDNEIIITFVDDEFLKLGIKSINKN